MALFFCKEPSHIYYGNRAFALLKLKNYEGCLEDCNKALKLNHLYVKGHFRKAKALKGLKLYKDALESIARGLLIVKPDAKEEFLKLRKMIHREIGDGISLPKKRGRSLKLCRNGWIKEKPIL